MGEVSGVLVRRAVGTAHDVVLRDRTGIAGSPHVYTPPEWACLMDGVENREPHYLRAGLQVVAQNAKEVDRLTAFHLERQRQTLLVTGAPPEIIAVLDEASLRREVGGRAVLRAQLEYLIRSVEAPNITVQVLPYNRGAHGALTGSFTILDFHDPSEPSVAYVDSPGGNLYLQKPPDMRRFEKTFAAFRGAALDEVGSERWMRTAFKEM